MMTARRLLGSLVVLALPLVMVTIAAGGVAEAAGWYTIDVQPEEGIPGDWVAVSAGTLGAGTEYRLTFAGDEMGPQPITGMGFRVPCGYPPGTYTVEVEARIGIQTWVSQGTHEFRLRYPDLTVTADDQEITYGEAPPDFTFTAGDFKCGHGIDDIDTPPVCTGPSVQDAGHGYPITCSGGSDNYYGFAGYQAGQLTIRKATLQAKCDDKVMTVGNSAPEYTVTFDAADWKHGDDAGVIDVEPDCAPETQDYGAPGTFEIACSAPGSDNNYAIECEPGTLTIEASSVPVGSSVPDSSVPGSPSTATLTVTADDRTMSAGDADPEFTFTYSGFRVGDDESVIDTRPTCGVDAEHSVEGSYPITCSGGSDDAYAFDYVAGTLVVQDERNAGFPWWIWLVMAFGAAGLLAAAYALGRRNQEPRVTPTT